MQQLLPLEEHLAGSQSDIGLVAIEPFAPEWEREPRPFYNHAIPYPPKARKWLKALTDEYCEKGIIRRAEVTGPNRPRGIANIVLVPEG